MYADTVQEELPTGLEDTVELRAVIVSPPSLLADSVSALEGETESLTREAASMLDEDVEAGVMAASVAASLQRIAESLTMDSDAVRPALRD
jgi:hypothetical protein